MTSRFASVTFKMASKVFIEETDKNFDFITEILFRFLGFGDFKVSIVIENLACSKRSDSGERCEVKRSAIK